ncbi:MAG: 50S ribosomal protein L28 [Ureaplasma sp.]|nr:50S ribosomal protein L28 [Ureaplasma sp.]MDE7222085.1 50S ribosomal protein L28 [Ureaplasma sp.]
MSRIDQLTLKGPLTGNKRSHAMNHSRRVWNVNLQKIRVRDANGSIVTLRVSARTIKSLSHVRIRNKNKTSNSEIAE